MDESDRKLGVVLQTVLPALFVIAVAYTAVHFAMYPTFAFCSANGRFNSTDCEKFLHRHLPCFKGDNYATTHMCRYIHDRIANKDMFLIVYSIIPMYCEELGGMLFLEQATTEEFIFSMSGWQMIKAREFFNDPLSRYMVKKEHVHFFDAIANVTW